MSTRCDVCDSLFDAFTVARQVMCNCPSCGFDLSKNAAILEARRQRRVGDPLSDPGPLTEDTLNTLRDRIGDQTFKQENPACPSWVGDNPTRRALEQGQASKVTVPKTTTPSGAVDAMKGFADAAKSAAMGMSSAMTHMIHPSGFPPRRRVHQSAHKPLPPAPNYQIGLTVTGRGAPTYNVPTDTADFQFTPRGDGSMLFEIRGVVTPHKVGQAIKDAKRFVKSDVRVVLPDTDRINRVPDPWFTDRPDWKGWDHQVFAGHPLKVGRAGECPPTHLPIFGGDSVADLNALIEDPRISVSSEAGPVAPELMWGITIDNLTALRCALRCVAAVRADPDAFASGDFPEGASCPALHQNAAQRAHAATVAKRADLSSSAQRVGLDPRAVTDSDVSRVHAARSFRCVRPDDFIMYAVQMGMTNPRHCDPASFPGARDVLIYPGDTLFAVVYPDHIRTGHIPKSVNPAQPIESLWDRFRDRVIAAVIGFISEDYGPEYAIPFMKLVGVDDPPLSMFRVFPNLHLKEAFETGMFIHRTPREVTVSIGDADRLHVSVESDDDTYYVKSRNREIGIYDLHEGGS